MFNNNNYSPNDYMEISNLKSNDFENPKKEEIREVEKVEPKEEGFNLLDRIKKISLNSKMPKIKNLKTIACILVFCILTILVLNLNLGSDKNTKTTTANTSYTSTLEYSRLLEEKLERVLGNIKGAGKTSVMVSLVNSLEIIIAETIDEKENATTSGTSTTSYKTTVTEPIILNGSNPLIIKEILPTIKGVIVVSEGAGDTMVKLNLIQAVKAILDVASGNIQVFAGK